MPKTLKAAITQRPSPVPIRSMQAQTSLRPSSGAWNPKDDEILMSARSQGQNWAPIQQAHFPSKTPNACRKRHERLMERRNAEDWDAMKLEKLGKEYMDMRKEMWGMLAARVGEKWQVVEQKCLEKGLKNLQSAQRTGLRREKMVTGDDSGIAEMDNEMDIGGDFDCRESGERSDGQSMPSKRNSIASILHATSQS
ncbi:MAG: hypothetical protein M1827_000884 [Pycnora praestabilis]|nr:MAG: hypothetical protein M1827_000884 [Pycnora praestabilis]